MTFNLNSLSPRERDQAIDAVMNYLLGRGYHVFGPDGGLEQHPREIQALSEHDRTVRSQAFLDAAEIVFNGHGRRQTPMQLAIKLRNLAQRGRSVV